MLRSIAVTIALCHCPPVPWQGNAPTAAGPSTAGKATVMNWWELVLWCASPAFIGISLMLERQRRTRSTAGTMRPVTTLAVMLGGPLPGSRHEDRLGADRLYEAHRRSGLEPFHHSHASHEVDLVVGLSRIIAELLILPFRLAWWAWAARTWRPLALLLAYLLAVASPASWVYAAADSVLDARETGPAAAYPALAQIPILLAVGLWPWQGRRSLIYSGLAAMCLAAWVFALWTL